MKTCSGRKLNTDINYLYVLDSFNAIKQKQIFSLLKIKSCFFFFFFFQNVLQLKTNLLVQYRRAVENVFNYLSQNDLHVNLEKKKGWQSFWGFVIGTRAALGHISGKIVSRRSWYTIQSRLTMMHYTFLYLRLPTRLGNQ